MLVVLALGRRFGVADKKFALVMVGYGEPGPSEEMFEPVKPKVGMSLSKNAPIVSPLSSVRGREVVCGRKGLVRPPSMLSIRVDEFRRGLVIIHGAGVG